MNRFILFFILMIFLVPCVEAESSYLKDLSINNGYMTLDFDKLNTNYTIILNEGEDALDINYDLEDEYASLIIYNNYGLLLSNKEVIIRVISSDEKSESLYHLNVIKESDETVSNMNEQIALEIKKTSFREII